MRAHPRTLAVVLAGGAGSRLGPLTRERAKPAVPFGGTYRLVDVALSNLAHSRVEDVWVLVQYEPHGLMRYLAGGRPWDLDRTVGGFELLPPFEVHGAPDDPAKRTPEQKGGFAEGNADALLRHRDALAAHPAETVVVLSADHLYRLDFRDVLGAHAASGAALTAVTTRVPRAEASRYGLVTVDAGGRVTAFAYKPDEPASTLATAEVFVYAKDALLGALTALADAHEGRGKRPLGDFGDELLPHLVAQGGVHAYALGGYWRDVGTPDAYLAAHYDLLRAPAPFALDDPAWPLRSNAAPRAPARLRDGARVAHSLVSPGADVAGTVRHSVVGPGVVVEAGATVVGSVLLGDGHVGAGARVACTIADEGVRIGSEARVGAAPRGFGNDGHPDIPADRIVVLGKGARVAAGHTVAPGAQVDPRGRR